MTQTKCKKKSPSRCMLKAQKQAAKRPTTIYKEVQQHERYGKNDRGPESSGAGPYIFLNFKGNIRILGRAERGGVLGKRTGNIGVDGFHTDGVKEQP